MNNFFQTLSLINALPLNRDAHHLIKELCFHKIQRIPKDDIRYQLLSNIPSKEYDEQDDTSFVYLNINEDKDYYIVFVPSANKRNVELQIQTLEYSRSEQMDVVSVVDAHAFEIM